MELGNALFGNSRGTYEINRDSASHKSLYQLVTVLGGDNYGQFNENDFKRIRQRAPQLTAELAPYAQEDQYLLLRRQTDNQPIALIRPYYWGDDNTIADKPNFVLFDANLAIDWYKYMGRDMYSNQDEDATLDALQTFTTKYVKL